MGTRVRDIDGSRSIMIDANNHHQPDSFFLVGPQGLRMEFAREAFRQAVMQEFGLVEESEVRLLAVS